MRWMRKRVRRGWCGLNHVKYVIVRYHRKYNKWYMYVWEYVIVEYICILNLSIRTPGRPMRRVYSFVPLTLFYVIACTGEAYYGVCIHIQSYPIKSMCAA